MSLMKVIIVLNWLSFFLFQNKQQLDTLKDSLQDEISYHKDQIDDHEVS